MSESNERQPLDYRSGAKGKNTGTIVLIKQHKKKHGIH